MIKLTGLWKKAGKNGDYLGGRLGGASIKVFPNGYKKQANDPDYIIYVDEAPKQNQSYRGQRQAAPQALPQARPAAQARTPSALPPGGPEWDDQDPGPGPDDVPF